MRINQKSYGRLLPRMTISGLLLAALCFNGQVQASHDQSTHPELAAALSQTIAAALQQDQEFSLFTTALKTSDLWGSVETAKNITLFVPSDEVLRHEGSAFLLDVVLLKHENSERLSQLMSQHVFPQADALIDITSLTNVTSLSNSFGGCVSVDPSGEGSVRVGPEAVVTSTRKFANGQIVYIDRLLWQHYQGSNRCR